MIHKLLENKKIILASGSPRRAELFELLNINFDVIPSSIIEDHSINVPKDFVLHNSALKAKDISTSHSDSFVIGADTIVVKENKIFVKPKNRDDAIQTLKELSGNAHFVYSGFTIVYKNKVVSNYAKTKVFFEKLSNSEIGEYINTDECDDKAGAYGIQGFGAQFIEKIEGDYFTVMGFPISKFYSTLKQYPQILR